jgi:hypothetical protein
MLLAPDPVVPHRDALLAGRALREPAELTYAKYRVGESLRVVHRTERGPVAARAFPPGESGAAFERALAATPADGVTHAPELDAVLWRFPNDRRLARLPLLAGRSDELDGLVGRPVEPRLVAYCAERSATAECLDGGSRVVAYAKVHVGEGAERERRALADVGARLADDPRVRVPRVLGSAEGALAVEAVHGRRLDAVAAPDGLARLGAGLAALHEHGGLPGWRFGRLDLERLAKAVGVIARARPDAGGAAARLLATLLDNREDGLGPAVCLHGDPTVRNAVLVNGSVALIDFEDVSAGPAAADLGRLLAALPPDGAEAVLRGYASVRPPPEPPALRWHIAASVLARVAVPAVGRVRPAELRSLRTLLETAWR